MKGHVRHRGRQPVYFGKRTMRISGHIKSSSKISAIHLCSSMLETMFCCSFKVTTSWWRCPLMKRNGLTVSCFRKRQSVSVPHPRKGDLSTKTWGFGFFKIQFFENLKNMCFSVFCLFYLFFFFVVFFFLCVLSFFRVCCVVLLFFFFFLCFLGFSLNFMFLHFFFNFSFFTCFLSFSFIFLQFFNVLLFLA